MVAPAFFKGRRFYLRAAQESVTPLVQQVTKVVPIIGIRRLEVFQILQEGRPELNYVEVIPVRYWKNKETGEHAQLADPPSAAEMATGEWALAGYDWITVFGEGSKILSTRKVSKLDGN